MAELETRPTRTRVAEFLTGKSCLYIKWLADVDMDVIEQLIQGSVARCGARAS